MDTKPAETTHKVRNWCLGTVLGAMFISVICNLISDTIPNPINYLIRWITGQQEKAALEAPKARLDLLNLDGKTPLKGTTVDTKWVTMPAPQPNWLHIPATIINTGEADSGELRFFYFLDSNLPRPEGAKDSPEAGYGHQMPTGSINNANKGNLGSGDTYKEGLGIAFGPGTAKPKAGEYKFLVRIKNAQGTPLYEGACTLRIP